ncbi:MAG: hypothetical protein ACOZBL_04050 [Patescibacteria group bacterium]
MFVQILSPVGAVESVTLRFIRDETIAFHQLFDQSFALEAKLNDIFQANATFGAKVNSS